MNINKCYPERPCFLPFNNVLNKPVFCIIKTLFDIYMSDICDVNKNNCYENHKLYRLGMSQV